MMALAAQPEPILQIHGADFKEAGGTIRTSTTEPPATPRKGHVGTAGSTSSATLAAVVPPLPASDGSPELPEHSGQQQNASQTSRPQVSVAYKRLPQKSKDRLEEVLIGWAAWHAAAYGNEPDSSHDSLVVNITPVQPETRCSGRLRFEPLMLSTTDDAPPDPSFAAAGAWVDIPEGGEEQQQVAGRAAFNLAYEKGGNVPRYDRGVPTPLGLGGSAGTSAQQDAAMPSPAPRPGRAPQRCFNCGSYSHALRDCWQPRDSSAVTAARAEFTSNSGGTIAGMKLPSRYFALIDGAKDTSEAVLGDTTAQPAADGEPAPGQLSNELRAALGISPSAPPPWLARMRQLGYPPGYMAPEADTAAGTDAVQLVFGDDAPAEMHAAWAATSSTTAARAGATADGPASEEGDTAARGTAASAKPAPGSSTAAQAATEAEAALVARLVAALSGARFDSGDVRGVNLTGLPQGCRIPEARLEGDIVMAITSSMPIDKAAQLAASELQAGAGPDGGSTLTRKQIKRAFVMAAKRRAAFPGLNAPLPQGVDVAAWSAVEQEAKAGQSQQQRPALAGSKRGHPEPQPPGTGTPGRANGSAAAGMQSPSQDQQHKWQRQAANGSISGNVAGPIRLMNGQYAPPRPIPGWPSYQHPYAYPAPAPHPPLPPPQQLRHGTQAHPPLQAYSPEYTPRPVQGAAGAAPPQPAVPSRAPSPSVGVLQQQQQQQQQEDACLPSWAQHPPPAPVPPPPPPTPPMPPVPQQPQPVPAPYAQPAAQQPPWPGMQPPGTQQAQHASTGPPGPQPVHSAGLPMQQGQQQALQTLPDWQPPRQQMGAQRSGAWQQTFLTPAAQQVWSPIQQPPLQMLQYDHQQPPPSQQWQQHYLPQPTTASTEGWQQPQQDQQQSQGTPPQPPQLPTPQPGGWHGQQQPPLPPVPSSQPIQQQALVHGHQQPFQQQPQAQWQQAAWQQ